MIAQGRGYRILPSASALGLKIPSYDLVVIRWTCGIGEDGETGGVMIEWANAREWDEGPVGEEKAKKAGDWADTSVEAMVGVMSMLVLE